VPSGVVSGRWSSRGGGALQIPKALRGAVVADPGWALVVADAGQLEPRVLAALSHDPGMLRATADPSGDLYTALARQVSGTAEVSDQQRAEMKVALLSAMYGGGAGGPGMAALRRRFPAALAFLERAARTGEDGGLVRSVLGRTCPPPSDGWIAGVPDAVVAARARGRGRFTRNFVIQASAADWANAFIASLRLRLAGLSAQPQPELVFFLHDEVIVHTPTALADDVVRAVQEAGAHACRLVLPEPVPVPLATRVAATA
jgi:DNA polymerase-1